ncbi:MAG TPA: hypothetical protein VMT68_06675 [Caulobacteraceae bacterium]|nr:hypothetical protein [Caulobacteraceae bacterium]
MFEIFKFVIALTVALGAIWLPGAVIIDVARRLRSFRPSARLLNAAGPARDL